MQYRLTLMSKETKQTLSSVPVFRDVDSAGFRSAVSEALLLEGTRRYCSGPKGVGIPLPLSHVVLRYATANTKRTHCTRGIQIRFGSPLGTYKNQGICHIPFITHISDVHN